MKHEVAEEHAAKFADWIANRGGILIWHDANIGGGGGSVSTPALTDGKPTPSPGWRYPSPTGHVTSIDEVEVYTTKVVETFVVKLKQNRYGQITLNDASSRRVNRAKERHGEMCFHRFKSTGSGKGDPVTGIMFGEDEIEICVDGSRVPLHQWLETNQPVTTQALP
jgi:hypothetical protein